MLMTTLLLVSSPSAVSGTYTLPHSRAEIQLPPGPSEHVAGPQLANSSSSAFAPSQLARLSGASRSYASHSSFGAEPHNNPLLDDATRDALLAYACRVYESSLRPDSTGLSHVPMSTSMASQLPDGEVLTEQLLPLLNMLKTLHARHLPTALLLGCVYFSLGNYQMSLSINQDILSIDPNYVSTAAIIGHWDGHDNCAG